MKGLVALSIAYVLSQFYRSFLAVLTPQLSVELGADKADLSLASGLWFFCFAMMQFVVGVGLDKHGPRRTASLIFGVGTGTGALVFATAQSPTAIIIAMCLFGIGCAPVLMAALFIFAQRFAPSTFAVMTSWFVAFGNSGNVIGSSPMAAAVDLYGWRETMLALGAFSTAVALCIFWLVKDPAATPQDAPSNSITPDAQLSCAKPSDSGLSGYVALFKIPVLWPIMFMTLFCYAPVAGIRGLWAGPYLHDMYSGTALQIGQVTLFMAIAMIVGSLLYGPMDRWFNSRKWVVFTGNSIVLGTLLVLTMQPLSSIGTVSVLFVILGLAGTSYGVLMAHGRAYLPSHLIGRGVTLFNFCSIFGVGLMQFISGRVIEHQANPAAPASYQLLFSVYATALITALAVYWFSKDAKPKQASPSSTP